MQRDDLRAYWCSYSLVERVGCSDVKGMSCAAGAEARAHHRPGIPHRREQPAELGEYQPDESRFWVCGLGPDAIPAQKGPELQSAAAVVQRA